MFKHIACRNSIYAKTIQRFLVPDDKVFWSESYEDYQPIHFESTVLKGKPWADPSIEDNNFKPKFNELDGNINRVSHIGKYNIHNGKFPLNPFGRTGISGRGILGRWGPNHAADPIVSTWKRINGEIVKHSQTQKPILQVLCIQRGDTGEIAIPGGMVDPGEQVSTTLKREFIEETLNGKIDESQLDEFFKNGHEIYRGYVDDPRNTDNGEQKIHTIFFFNSYKIFLIST
jgi:ADP-ribose pyrophosphatase